MLFKEDLPIKILEDKVLLYIKVTPKASKSRIGKIFNNLLKIYVTDTPEAGQANKAVLELISQTFKISKSYISITHGLTDQNKVIEIRGVPEKIIQILLTGI